MSYELSNAWHGLGHVGHLILAILLLAAFVLAIFWAVMSR